MSKTNNVERKFNGQLTFNESNTNEERNFHKSWLKAYIKGNFLFQFHRRMYSVVTGNEMPKYNHLVSY